MENNLARLISLLTETFYGNPWYGDSVMEKLRQIDFKYVNITPNHSGNSIAKIVSHMIQWRIFTYQKLNRDNLFEIELNSKEDWPEISIRNEKEWENLLENLSNTQNLIIKTLQKIDDKEFLAKICPGKTYNFDFLINGIIHHDIYHLGQIGLIYQQLKITKEAIKV